MIRKTLGMAVVLAMGIYYPHTASALELQEPSTTSPVPHADMSAQAVNQEAQNISNQLSQKVAGVETLTQEDAQKWIGRVKAQIRDNSFEVTYPQILVTVDRNPKVQKLQLVLAQPGQSWFTLGGTHVSTGKPGRKEHFKTPTGVFRNTDDILGYRAQGTYNSNGIRGLGVKGMRVWDFGWQKTENWRVAGALSEIRLEMHATDPANLEHRIGRPDSEGCIRIPAALNKFIDHYGIIDNQYEAAAQTDRRFEALLPRDREPTTLAGDSVVVFDSSAR